MPRKTADFRVIYVGTLADEQDVVLKAEIGDLIHTRAICCFPCPLYVDSTLGSSDARVKRHMAAAPIDTMLAEHASGRRDHGQALWMLLTLEVFLRREGW